MFENVNIVQCGPCPVPSTVTVKECVAEPWLLDALHSYSPSSSRLTLSK